MKSHNALAMALLLLVGCNDGDSSRPGTVVTPTSTPGAPTPAPSLSYTPIDLLNTDRSFAFAHIGIRRTNQSLENFGYPRGALFRYAAASQQWSFSGTPAVHSPADLVETTPDLIRYFNPKPDGTIPPEWDDGFSIYNLSVSGKRLQYVRGYRLLDVTTGFGQPYWTQPLLWFGAFGVPTLGGDALSVKPTNYKIQLVGAVLSSNGGPVFEVKADNQEYDLAGSTGTLSMSADGILTSQITFVGTPRGGGAPVALGTRTITGGTVSAIDVGFGLYGGEVKGTFFGPGGREIGGVVSIVDALPGSPNKKRIIAGFVGIQD